MYTIFLYNTGAGSGKMYNMDSVDVAQARKSLSELVRRASEGERFTITKYGKPMAMLVSYDPDTEVDLGAEVQNRQMRLVNDVPGPADSTNPNTPDPESLRWQRLQEQKKKQRAIDDLLRGVKR